MVDQYQVSCYIIYLLLLHYRTIGSRYPVTTVTVAIIVVITIHSIEVRNRLAYMVRPCCGQLYNEGQSKILRHTRIVRLNLVSQEKGVREVKLTFSISYFSNTHTHTHTHTRTNLVPVAFSIWALLQLQMKSHSRQTPFIRPSI